EMSPPSPKKYTFVEMDLKLSQLNQFLGQQKYQPAEATLRKFVPHVPTQPLPESRGAAIWALGQIREGKPDVALAKELEARITDTRSIPPEEAQVRLMSAITIGRMRVKESVPPLRGFSPENQFLGEAIHDACAWAIASLPGEAMAPPKPFRPGQL